MASDGNSQCPVKLFMTNYRRGHHSSRQRAKNVIEICSRAFREAGILSSINYTSIDSQRLEGELRTREAVSGKHYQEKEEIEADVIDLACVSVQLHLAQEKQCISEIIRQNFKLYWPLTTEGVSVTSPRATNLDTEYYWVSLEDEKDLWPPRIIEIQVSTDQSDILFCNQHEVGVFLCEWAADGGRVGDCGDVRPLWELMRVLNLRSVADFKAILADVDISAAPNSDYSCMAHEFAGVEFSLAIYVAVTLMGLPCAKMSIQDTNNSWEGRPKPQQQRRDMEVIRNSFIWLAYLYSWDERAGKMLLGHLKKAEQDLQQKRIIWLDGRCAKRFCDGKATEISDQEANDLKKLRHLFEKHERLPAQYVFNLARLGVKGHAPPCWPDFRRAIFDLVYSGKSSLDRLQ
ncbi:hypothetical protein BDV06DRAFT_134309 [Aspergillus oleicola]